MDIYTKNGNIIRQFSKEDGTAEIELEFLFDDLFWTRMFSVAIFYVTFYENLKIDYVHTNHTYTRAAVREANLGEKVKQELIQAVLQVKENSIMLRAFADKLLFNQSDIENVDTNADERLFPFKAVEVRGKRFLAAFADELRKKVHNSRGEGGTAPVQ